METEFYKNLYGTDEYNSWAAKSAYVEAEEYFQEEAEIVLPDGYSVFYRSYEHQEGYRILASFVRYQLRKDGKCIYEYTSIDHNTPVLKEFIKHSNGHTYYPFHIDLYGLSFLDLDTMEVYNYIPKGEEHDYDAPYGESFIITDIHYDPATNLVAYGGCYWACPYDTMVGDLSDPMNFDPHLKSIGKLMHQDNEDLPWYNIDPIRWTHEGLEVIIDDKKKRTFSKDLFLKK